MQSIAPAPVAPMHNQDDDLRAQLAASLSHNPTSSHGYSDVQPASSSASPHEQNIDPAIGGQTMADSPVGDDDGRRAGGKRELSQSKRAAQNRAAQRAFRQRKEGYIKKLEEQCREFHTLEDNYKALQAENYSLREYIIHLQSRLLESQGEYPPAPPNVNLNQPGPGRPTTTAGSGQLDGLARESDGQSVSALNTSPINPIQAAAARNIAAAGLKHPQEAQDFSPNKRFKDDDQADEDIIRSQLQSSADGLPTNV